MVFFIPLYFGFLGEVLSHCWDSCIRKLCVCLSPITNDESSPLTFEIFIYSIRHSCTNLFPQLTAYCFIKHTFTVRTPRECGSVERGSVSDVRGGCHTVLLNIPLENNTDLLRYLHRIRNSAELSAIINRSENVLKNGKSYDYQIFLSKHGTKYKRGRCTNRELVVFAGERHGRGNGLKEKNKDLASEFQKSHQGSKEGELLCDKAVPAAKSTPQSSEHMHMYDDWNCVTTRYIYTLTLHPAESCALSVTGARISWCLWLDTGSKRDDHAASQSFILIG